MNKEDNQFVEHLAYKFGITVKYFDFDNGQSEVDTSTNTIYLRPNESLFIALHEIGHIIAGDVCCMNHAEYVAHGVALGLCRNYRIPIPVNHIDILQNCARKKCENFRG